MSEVVGTQLWAGRVLAEDQLEVLPQVEVLVVLVLDRGKVSCYMMYTASSRRLMLVSIHVD